METYSYFYKGDYVEILYKDLIGLFFTILFKVDFLLELEHNAKYGECL